MALGGGFIVCGSWMLIARARAAEPDRSPERALHSERRSAMRFERNQGQFEDRIRFLARGPHYALALSDEGASLSLPGGADGAPALVSLRLAGARPVEPVGIGELEGRSNYLVGADRKRWVEGASSFGSVRYPAVLPGVDLVYYSSDAHELEYDLVLAPGVRPDGLELELEGSQSLELDTQGNATFRLSGGAVLKQQAPIAYQLGMDGERHFFPASFVKRGASRFGVRVRGFDPAKPLVIDPTLSYSTYLGGSRFDEFVAVAADSAGNTYAVGYTTGTLFPTQAPAQPTYGGGASDAVIVKLNAAGSGFVYATYLGGSDADRAYGVAVDGNGNAYLTGVTYSTNFPKLGAMQGALGGQQDAFVSKLSANGTLVYSSYLGGAGDDLGQAITVNASGEAYVAGTTFSSDFPKVAAFQSSLSGTNDAFVSKWSASGGVLSLSTFLGGSGGEYGQAIALDNTGGAIVAGQTGSSNFPLKLPAQGSFGGATSDAFVTRLTPAGNALVYSTYLGGTSSDVATGVAQIGGAAIVTGYTSSANFPAVGAAQGRGGGTDAFLTRVDGAGGSFDFSTFLGGAADDQANGVAVDSNGFVYVAGQTSSANFPLLTPLEGQTTLRGTSDAFLASFSPSGVKLYSSYLGGDGSDVGTSVGLASGALHVLGNTFSTNFPVVSGMFIGPLGPQDGFVARLPVQSFVPSPWAASGTTWGLALLLVGAGFLVSAQRARRA